MEIRRLDHAALLIKDVERSRRFYGQVLGMEEVPRPSNFTFPGAWFRKGRAEIHLIGESEPGRAAQVQPGAYRPDELSVGYGAHFAFEVTDLEYPCHMMCRKYGITHYENLANLDQVVGKRFTFMGFPLRIRAGTGSPVRAVALLSD